MNCRGASAISKLSHSRGRCVIENTDSNRAVGRRHSDRMQGIGGIDPATAGSVGDLWSELNLGDLLEGVKATNKNSSMGLNKVAGILRIYFCVAVMLSVFSGERPFCGT